MATEYQVVRAKSIAVLETRVNTAIENGWEPIGGVCEGVNEFDGEAYLMQAMVR